MAIEARQLSLRYLNASKRAETESARLLVEAQKETKRGPGTRAAVLAQQAYETRLNAETSRFMAAFSLVASDLGAEAVSARQVARTAQNATQQRVLVEKAQHAERRSNLMSLAADSMTKALKDLPGLKYGKPPSGQQVTVGMTQSFRPSAFTDRFAHFFPADIRAAAGSFQGVDTLSASFGASEDAVLEARHAIARDLPTVRANCRRLADHVPGVSGDPGAAARIQQAIGLADSGLSADTAAAVLSTPSSPVSLKTVLLGAGAVGLAYYLFTRS